MLFDDRRYEGAYYLLGYAVECALRAYIAKQAKRYDFLDKKFVNDIYTHDLNKLLSVSGLDPEYREEIVKTPNFELNWTVVKDWTEQSRYARDLSRAKAKDFRSAVVSRRTGILPWLQKRW